MKYLLLLFVAFAFLCPMVKAQRGSGDGGTSTGPRQDLNTYYPPDPNAWYYNLEKYWWYRYRLVNDFLKIGSECGESIPATRREKSTYWDENGRRKLKWGDATIDLGNYITMLATEYRHLKNNKLDTRRTEMELYYALNAYERLDRDAEAYCYDIDGTYPCKPYNKWSNKLNGFFVRDDIPTYEKSPYQSFVQINYEHFNRNGIRNRMEVIGVESGAFSNAVFAPPQSKQRMPTEESQDQVRQLAMGMLFTAAKLSGATYNGEDLARKASDNFYRIASFIQKNDWKIMNPVTGSCVYGVDPGNDCERGGALCYVTARGMALAADKYCSPSGNTSILKTSTEDFLNLVWQLEQYVPLKDCNFYGLYAAFTDSWYFEIGGRIGNLGLGYKINTTYRSLKVMSEYSNMKSPEQPLLYQWMFGKKEDYLFNWYQRLFTAAPPCGIHNYGETYATGTPEWQWTSNDLIHEWNHRGEQNNSDCNGLDYMGLFNMYAAHDDKYLKQYFNPYYKTNYNYNYPTALGYGNKSRKLTLNFLEYLSAQNRIAGNGDVTYRGAKVIDLLPGFDAQPGCNFTAYIQDYDISCDYQTGTTSGGRPIRVGYPAYHYAEINSKPVVFVGARTTGEMAADSAYFMDFAPDAEPFVPEALPMAEPEDSTLITCEMERDYFNDLVRQIYESGDETLIAYVDSVIIPNAVFPACNGDVLQRQAATVNNQPIQIYPNPTNDGNLTIAVPTADNYTVRVSDLMGREIYRDVMTASEKTKKIKLDAPPGTYIININSNKSRTTQKVTLIQ